MGLLYSAWFHILILSGTVLSQIASAPSFDHVPTLSKKDLRNYVYQIAREYSNNGSVIEKLSKILDSLGEIDLAIHLNKDVTHPSAVIRVARLLYSKKQVEDAIAKLDEALESPEINEYYATVALRTKAAILELEGQGEAAKPLLRQLLEIDPGNKEGSLMLAQMLYSEERYQECVDVLEHAYTTRAVDYMAPLILEIGCRKRAVSGWNKYGAVFKRLRRLAIFEGTDDEIHLLANRCRELFEAIPPANCSSLLKITADHKMSTFNSESRLLRQQDIPTPPPLNVAFLSSFAWGSEVLSTRCVQSLFSHLPKGIRSHCIGMGSRYRDDEPPRTLVRKECGSFAELTDDSAATEDIIKRKIHITVDVQSGYSPDFFHRLRTRPAPVQISFHGTPGTTGTKEMDYLVTDKFVVPPQYSGLYQEKLIFMPHSYFFASHAEAFSETGENEPDAPSRSTLGLPPSEVFVFCSFNSYFKLTPGLFRAWMAILRKVKKSVLWLLHFARDDLGSQEELRKWAREAKVDPRRIIFTLRFARRLEYFSKGYCDLHLDTPIFNGHSTTVDALWAGVPVLAMHGSADWVSRVAVSLIHASGLPPEDFIANDIKDYVNKAVAIASDRERHRELRAHLMETKADSDLFNVSAWASAFSRALEQTWDVFAARGEGRPLHIVV